MIIDNRNQRLAFEHLHLATSLTVLLYSYLTLRFIMSQPKKARTTWDTPQELRMIALLTSVKTTADHGAATFKKAQLTQVADAINREFTQLGAPKTHSNIQTKWSKVSAVCHF